MSFDIRSYVSAAAGRASRNPDAAKLFLALSVVIVVATVAVAIVFLTLP